MPECEDSKGFPVGVMFEFRSGASWEAPGEGGMELKEQSREMASANTVSLDQQFSTFVYIGIILRAFKSMDAWVLFSAFLMDLVWGVAWTLGPLKV